MRNSAWYSKLWHKKLGEIPLKEDAAAAWQNMNSLLDQQLPVNSTPSSATSAGHTAAGHAAKSIAAKIAGYLGYILPAAAIISTTVYFFSLGSDQSKSIDPVKDQKVRAATKFTDTAVSNDPGLDSLESATDTSFNNAGIPEFAGADANLDLTGAVRKTAGSKPLGVNQTQVSASPLASSNSSGVPAIQNGNASSGKPRTSSPLTPFQNTRASSGKTDTKSASVYQRKTVYAARSHKNTPLIEDQNKTAGSGQTRGNPHVSTNQGWNFSSNGILQPVVHNGSGIVQSAGYTRPEHKLTLNGSGSAVRPNIPGMKKPGDSRFEKLKVRNEVKAAKRLRQEQLRADKYAAKIKAAKVKIIKEKPVKETKLTAYSYSLEAGINASKQNTFYFGAFGSYVLTPKWSVGAGLRLNTPRSFSNDYLDSIATQLDSFYSVTVKDQRSVLVMDIPVFLSYKLTDKLSIKGGPVISFPLKQSNIKATYIRNQTDSLVNIINPILKNTKMNGLNIGFSGGFNMQLKRFGIDAKYLLMSPYKFNNDLGSFRNTYQTFQLGITYRLK
ncbi:porin family protein [Pedobacter metabolipauper]|uniref:Outer membrane protein with beta-barrel domain n=1 Tax=Pedobacter metabolipauper TaxID=425513 RepID=A0A4R6T0L9_9SPHI|nr:outer membrane beta-barrel protein [Pedobacter metabolipauper]TDQ11915.1 outer membrane protein with beta-barrel domain [Pedobacter metabolipauper]